MRLFNGIVQTKIDATGSSYLCVGIDHVTVEPYLNYLSKILMPEDYQQYVRAQQIRDVSGHHMTIINPIEFKMIAEHSEWRSFIGYPVLIKMIGVGKLEELGAESYFVVCSCAEVSPMRRAAGFGPADTHITLGFKNRDIYDKPKSKASLIKPFSIIEVVDCQS